VDVDITIKSKMNRVIIDNCVVSKVGNNGIHICGKSAFMKRANVDINDIPIVTFGNRIKDNEIIKNLSDGVLKFNDLIPTDLIDEDLLPKKPLIGPYGNKAADEADIWLFGPKAAQLGPYGDKAPEIWTIFVKIVPVGKIIGVQVKPTTTLHELKHSIVAYENLTLISSINLSFKGSHLSDDNKTMSDYGISPWNTIFLVERGH
jgi:hypothetical protein